MVAVSNEPRLQAVVRQLRPEVVGMPWQLSMRAVAEMRAQARAGVHRGADLRRVGMSVPDRNPSAGGTTAAMNSALPGQCGDTVISPTSPSESC